MYAVVNLTLVDLPGLTKVAVGKWDNICLFMIVDPSPQYQVSLLTNINDIVDGQPESIVQDIENMVRSFIEKVTLIWNISDAYII